MYFSYEDFFGSNKKKASKRKSEVNDRSEDLDMGDEQEDSDMRDGLEDSDMGDEQEDSDMGDEQEDDGAFENKVFFFFFFFQNICAHCLVVVKFHSLLAGILVETHLILIFLFIEARDSFYP